MGRPPNGHCRRPRHQRGVAAARLGGEQLSEQSKNIVKIRGRASPLDPHPAGICYMAAQRNSSSVVMSTDTPALPPNIVDPLLTDKQIATALNICVETVERERKAGRMPPI